MLRNSCTKTEALVSIHLKSFLSFGLLKLCYLIIIIYTCLQKEEITWMIGADASAKAVVFSRYERFLELIGRLLTKVF